MAIWFWLLIIKDELTGRDEKRRCLIVYGPNGTNIDECGSNRANEYSQRDEVSEDAKQRDEYYKKLAEKNTEIIRIIEHMGGVAVGAIDLNPREHATQGELFPESWVTGQ